MSKRRILTDEEKNKIEKCKKELNKYREDIRYIQEKIDDAEEVKSTLYKVTSTFSQCKADNKNNNTDKFADGISKLEDLEIDCSDKLKQMLVEKFEIDNKIESIEQPYKNILFYRYTRGKSWENVAKELGYTREYVCDLHGEALYLYSKI